MQRPRRNVALIICAQRTPSITTVAQIRRRVLTARQVSRRLRVLQLANLRVLRASMPTNFGVPKQGSMARALTRHRRHARTASSLLILRAARTLSYHRATLVLLVLAIGAHRRLRATYIQLKLSVPRLLLDTL